MIHALGVGGIQDRAPVPVADEELVEWGQEVHPARRAPPRARRRRAPELAAVHELSGEPRPREGDRFPGGTGREPRPPGEVLDRGGAVAREVAGGELCERLGARQCPRGRHPLLEERERLLLPFARGGAEEPLLRKSREDVDPALARRGDAPLAQRRVQGVAREPPAPVQRPREEVPAPSERGIVEAELPLARRARRDGRRREQREHPADVRGGHEVERAPHRPGSDDGAVGDRALDGGLVRAPRPQPHRPERSEVVLRLHGAEEGDGLPRVREPRPRHALGEQPAPREVAPDHPGLVPPGRRRAPWKRGRIAPRRRSP